MEKVLSNEMNVMCNVMLDEKETCSKVQELFKKYRIYKEKQKIIETRNKSPFSFDNMGIFGSRTSDPTGNKVEQIMRYKDFTDTIDNTYKLFSNKLEKDEKVIYEKTLKTKHTVEDVMAELSITNRKTFYNKKNRCYLKVAMWFDLEVYKQYY